MNVMRLIVISYPLVSNSTFNSVFGPSCDFSGIIILFAEHLITCISEFSNFWSNTFHVIGVKKVKFNLQLAG